MVRTFIAVRVPATEPLVEALEQLQTMGAALRAVAVENLHLTLRFLGSVEERRLGELEAMIRRAVQGLGPMEVELAGVGAFPSPTRPNVIWAGVQGRDVGVLQNLAQRLEKSVVEMGFEPESRPWLPHLTLARVKARPPQRLGQFFQKYGRCFFGRVRIDSVDLMLSQLTPQGPIYRAAAVVELSSSAI